MSAIKRRSSLKQFLNSMRTKYWYEDLRKITKTTSNMKLVDYLSNLNDEQNKAKPISENTWKIYSAGKKTPLLSTIIHIDKLIPGSAKSFLLGPDGVPLWVSLSDRVNPSDVDTAWIRSFKWPDDVVEEYDFSRIDPIKNITTNPSKGIDPIYLNSLESYESIYKINQYQAPISISSFYPLTYLCRDFDQPLPEVNFWHSLTRIILVYRMMFASDVLELHFQMRNISWADHYRQELEDDFDDENLDSYMDIFEYNNTMYPDDWNYSLSVNENITRKEIQSDFLTLLDDNDKLIKSYGLHPQDFLFLMMNLHSEARMAMPFNKRKKFPRWSKSVIETDD